VCTTPPPPPPTTRSDMSETPSVVSLLSVFYFFHLFFTYVLLLLLLLFFFLIIFSPLRAFHCFSFSHEVFPPAPLVSSPPLARPRPLLLLYRYLFTRAPRIHIDMLLHLRGKGLNIRRRRRRIKVGRVIGTESMQPSKNSTRTQWSSFYFSPRPPTRSLCTPRIAVRSSPRPPTLRNLPSVIYRPRIYYNIRYYNLYYVLSHSPVLYVCARG
jgi:hypothetical protein